MPGSGSGPMGKSDRPNHVLICGLLRDELEFRMTLSQVIDARADGVITGIVLSK